MSDFDDLFKNRLEEEASFPNRNKNWKQVSKRLEAFETGKTQVGKGQLRFWQLATGLSIAVAVFFVWKYQHLAQENQLLHKERNLLQEEVLRQKPVASLPSPAEKTPSVSTSSPETTLHTNRSTAPEEMPESMPTSKENEKRSALTTNQDGIKQHFSNTQNSQLPATAPLTNEIPQSSAGLHADQAAQENPVVLKEKRQNPEPSEALPAAHSNEDTVAARVVASIPEPSVTLPDSNAVKDKPIDSTRAIIAQVPTPANKELKPHRDRRLRFRAGIQGSVGWVQPHQKGVSPLRGQGISFEARVLPALWATASVDWMQHEISTEEFVPRFHPHHDSLPRPKDNYPGWPQQHPDKLVQVQSNPREQHFSLGLRYAVPLRFWVKPSIQLSHEWVRIAPTLVTYKFVEDNPFMPPHHDEDRYTAEKFPAQWLNKQMHLAIGLEKEVPDWTFGVWADYSKSFTAKTPSFDALYLRLKAQYVF